MRKLYHGIIMLVVLGSAIPCFAQDVGISLTAGNNLINGHVMYRRPGTMGDFVAGVGGYYRKDAPKRMSWVDALVGVSSYGMSPAMSFDVGFKGILGQAEDDRIEGNIGGLGFFVSGRYSLYEMTSYLPVSLVLDTFYIPEILAFQEMTDLLQVRAGIGIHIVETATLQLGYQFSRVGLDDGTRKSDVNDNAIYFGLGMSF